MDLITYRIIIYEDDSQEAYLVYLLENLAQARFNAIVEVYSRLGWETQPNSSPTHVQMTRRGKTTYIILRQQPFDDGKRFSINAFDLKIYDNT